MKNTEITKAAFTLAKALGRTALADVATAAPLRAVTKGVQSGFGRTALNAVKNVAGVPSGQRFFPSVTGGLSNVARGALSPNIGTAGRWAVRAPLYGYAAHSVGQTGKEMWDANEKLRQQAQGISTDINGSMSYRDSAGRDVAADGFYQNPALQSAVQRTARYGYPGALSSVVQNWDTFDPTTQDTLKQTGKNLATATGKKLTHFLNNTPDWHRALLYLNSPYSLTARELMDRGPEQRSFGTVTQQSLLADPRIPNRVRSKLEESLR